MNNQLFNPEAENAVIGYVIVNPEELNKLGLESGMFYLARNRILYDVIGRMTAAGKIPDTISLVDELDRIGKLNECGGPANIAILMNSYSYRHEAEQAAELVKELAQRRSMIQIASDIAKAAHNRDEKLDTGTFIDRLSRVADLSMGAVHWGKWLSDLYDDIEERAKNPSDVWGIKTGFSRFDKVTGGLQMGESFILSGKPGMGKSMLAMQMAEQMASNHAGALYSIEMTGISVARRIVSARSKIKASAMKSGRLNDNDWPVLLGAIERLNKLPVYMSDASNWTTTALRADLARLKAEHNIKWFVFDYMLLAGDAPSLDRNERTEMISRNMKLICRNLDLAGLIVHSMNKAGIDSTTPDMANLSGSGQVSYDADIIAFLNPFMAVTVSDGFIPANDQANMRTLLFAKGRELEDPARYLHLVKLKEYPVFGDYLPERN